MASLSVIILHVLSRIQLVSWSVGKGNGRATLRAGDNFLECSAKSAEATKMNRDGWLVVVKDQGCGSRPLDRAKRRWRSPRLIKHFISTIASSYTSLFSLTDFPSNQQPSNHVRYRIIKQLSDYSSNNHPPTMSGVDFIYTYVYLTMNMPTGIDAPPPLAKATQYESTKKRKRGEAQEDKRRIVSNTHVDLSFREEEEGRSSRSVS